MYIMALTPVIGEWFVNIGEKLGPFDLAIKQRLVLANEEGKDTWGPL